MNTAASHPRLRLDPWAAEYEASIQLPEPGEETATSVDTAVETTDWRALPCASSAGKRPACVAFVDGVRRVEQRLLVEDGARTAFGLLGSFGVGAVECRGTAATITQARIARVACCGGGTLLDALECPLRGSSATLRFTPLSVPENNPLAPVAGLQGAMRHAETELAESLAAGGALVFLDGPLTFLTAPDLPVLGSVKRLVRNYLPASHAGLLPDLGVTERTPLFVIGDGAAPRYSWYTRLGLGRPIDSALAGLVRLEVSAAVGLTTARALADTSTALLPTFASTPERDPRAPQNLTPIGALETRLRHLLGDPLLIRRAVLTRLHAEVAH